MTTTTTTKTQTAPDEVLASKVEKMLDMFRPILHSEGGDAKMISLKEGIAVIRMEDSGCSGCGSTPMSSLQPGLKMTLMEKVEGLKDVRFE
jgi:Fe-S cluster biogenesis protein NfuA